MPIVNYQLIIFTVSICFLKLKPHFSISLLQKSIPIKQKESVHLNHRKNQIRSTDMQQPIHFLSRIYEVIEIVPQTELLTTLNKLLINWNNGKDEQSTNSIQVMDMKSLFAMVKTQPHYFHPLSIEISISDSNQNCIKSIYFALILQT